MRFVIEPHKTFNFININYLLNYQRTTAITFLKIGTIIGFTWIFSILCAMPFAIHHRADYIMKSWPGTDNRIPVK